MYDKVVLTNINMKVLGKSNPTEVLPLYGRQPSRGNLPVEHTCTGDTANHSIYMSGRKKGMRSFNEAGRQEHRWKSLVAGSLSGFIIF